MSASAHVKRFIFSLPLDRVFTTRELLSFGNRNSIDLCLFKMVKNLDIFRLARGVFIRTANTAKHPSIEKIAFIKAASFGKSICTAGVEAAKKAKLLSKRNSVRTFCFYTSGCSSSFLSGTKRIQFIAASSRKRHLREDKIGNFLKGYWYLGKGANSQPLEKLRNVSQGMIRPERALLKALIKTMPVWMNKEFTQIWR